MSFTLGVFFSGKIFDLYFEIQSRLIQNKLEEKNVFDLDMKTCRNKTWNPSKEKGKSVLMYFWASWCSPCLDSLLTLNELYKKNKKRKDFKMVGINLDENKKDYRRVNKVYKLKWLQVCDAFQGFDMELVKRLGISHIPFMVNVDYRFNPPDQTIYSLTELQKKGQLRKIVEELLKR